MNEPPEITNPFPGLRPFETGEYRLFFGREGQSDELITRLGRSRFLAVVGTSGSGKSSLVRAGLLPALRGGMMAGAGAGWRVAVMRPGGDPVGNLARSLAEKEVLAEAGGGLPPAAAKALIEATLRGGSLGLVEAVKQARLADGEKLLVIADQFEEIFRFRAARAPSSTDDAAAFIKLLLEGARQREQNIYVVLTMRSDFLGDCSQFQGLPEAINDGQYLIPRMNRDERRAAIVGPVRVARGRMSEPLINRLLNDVGDNPDQLPILQHALMRTWENWAADHTEGERVDLRHYEAVGTMSGALSKHADEAYNELPDKRSRHIAQLLFKALTERGADNREIRRPTRLSEACVITDASTEEVAAVVEVFRKEGRSFLMPPAGGALTPDIVLDISHESLIRNWEQLKKWVTDEAQSARIYKRLAEAAMLNRAGEEGLMQDPGLSLTLDWREKSKPNAAWGRRYHPEFDTAIAYLDKSREAHEAALADIERRKQEEAAEIERRRQEIETRKQEEADRERHEMEQQRAFAEQQERSARREMEQTRANARRLRWAAAAMAVLLVLSLGTAAYAYRLKQRAELFLSLATDASKLADEEKRNAINEKQNAEKEQQKALKLAGDLETNNEKLVAERAEKERQAVIADEKRAEAEMEKKNALDAQAKAEREQENAKKNLDKAVAASHRGELTRSGLEFSRHNYPDRAEPSFDGLVQEIDKTLDGPRGNLKEDEVKNLNFELAWALQNLGAVRRETGKLDDAKASYERSVKLVEKLWTKEQQREMKPEAFLFEVYNGLGRTYHDIALRKADAADNGGANEAKKYFEQAKNVFEPALELQTTQFERARREAAEGKIGKGEADYFIAEGAKQVAADYLALAYLYRDWGQLEKAEKNLFELVNFQKEHGDADKLIAAREELAEFNRDQNLFRAAERDYTALIDEIERHVTDIEHVEGVYAQRGPELAESYSELSEVYRAQGTEKPEDAEKKNKKSEDAIAASMAIQRLVVRLRRLQTVEGSDDVDIRKDSPDEPADNAGDVYVKLGKFDRARLLYEYALGLREAGTGEIRRDLWKSYDKLTRLYREKGFADNSKAEEYNLKLIAELSNVEPNSARHAEALALCADIYVKQDRTSDARAYYEYALGIYAKQKETRPDFWMNQNIVLYKITEMYAKKRMRPELKEAALRRLELLTAQLNKIVSTKNSLPSGSITLVTEYLDAVETVAFTQSMDKNDVGAADVYRKAFDAYDFIKGRIYNQRALNAYIKTLNKYKTLLTKLGRQQEAADVEALVSGVRAKVNDINQEQSPQPTQPSQSQPVGAQ